MQLQYDTSPQLVDDIGIVRFRICVADVRDRLAPHVI